MRNDQVFRPDWVSSPGDTIRDLLQERNLPIDDFGNAIGRSPEQVSELVEGRATITIAIARQLHRLFGPSVGFWVSRDLQYRRDSARIHRADQEWLAQLPLTDMVRFGWIAPPRPSDETRACLDFFGVPSVGAWRERYGRLQDAVAFRMSRTFDSQPAAVAAWLRRGEIEAERADCNRWDRDRFLESLPGIRSLTRQKDPTTFLPELRMRCAECGVAVSVVRAPSGCRASGAAHFLSERRALLLLSFRFLSDDQFWFSFFHEAAHLVLHDRGGLFLDGPGMMRDAREDEANKFAAGTLVPLRFRAELLGLTANYRSAIRFARKVGVSPGIVVGQLQYEKRIDNNQLNRLKRRFSWDL